MRALEFGRVGWVSSKVRGEDLPILDVGQRHFVTFIVFFEFCLKFDLRRCRPASGHEALQVYSKETSGGTQQLRTLYYIYLYIFSHSAHMSAAPRMDRQTDRRTFQPDFLYHTCPHIWMQGS
jgi:hypothetical protein